MKSCILLLIGAFIFLNVLQCNKQAVKKENIPNNAHNYMIKDSIFLLSFEDAVKFYGKPVSSEVFDNQNGDTFPGIRAGIRKFYPDGKQKVSFREAIWNTNDSMKIAIWYVKKTSGWIPFDHLEYNNDTDF